MSSAVVPCLSSWGEEEITERERREKELGGYGLGQVHSNLQFFISTYAFIKLAAFVQVICKERCLGMESSECRDQLDGQPVDSISITVKLGPVFEQEGKQVFTTLRFLRIILGLFGKVSKSDFILCFEKLF